MGLFSVTVGTFINVLFFVDRKRQSLFQYDLDLDVSQRVGLIGHGMPHGLTFDKNKKKLFWSDPSFKHFGEACMDGVHVRCGKIIKTFSKYYIMFYHHSYSMYILMR